MTTKQPKIECHWSGCSITVSPAARWNGYCYCPGCGRDFKVGYKSKTKTIPKHNEQVKK